MFSVAVELFAGRQTRRQSTLVGIFVDFFTLIEGVFDNGLAQIGSFLKQGGLLLFLPQFPIARIVVVEPAQTAIAGLERSGLGTTIAVTEPVHSDITIWKVVLSKS